MTFHKNCDVILGCCIRSGPAWIINNQIENPIPIGYTSRQFITSVSLGTPLAITALKPRPLSRWGLVMHIVPKFCMPSGKLREESAYASATLQLPQLV